MFSEGTPFDINARLAITPGHDGTHSSDIHDRGPHQSYSHVSYRNVKSECCLSVRRRVRFKSWRVHISRWTTSTELVALDVTLEEPLHGGYAGVRLGEAQNPGPTEHKRDLSERKPSARRTRFDEAGDAVPGSQAAIDRKSSSCPTARSEPCRPCPTPRDPLNNDHDTIELTFDVLNAVWTWRPSLEVQILVLWCIWGISTAASL